MHHAFDAATRGTQLAVLETGTLGAITYTGLLRSAVYQNTLGTLDFYYQVAISSILPGDEVFNLTSGGFLGFTVDALVDATNFDGAGIFTAANNPNLQGPPGSTTTTSRNGSGSVVRADFGDNGLEAAGQTSATYISGPTRPTTIWAARSPRSTDRSRSARIFSRSLRFPSRRPGA
jgi:hypothetical protein